MMKLNITVSLALATLLVAQDANAACYTIYRDGAAIYQSPDSPVNMEFPFSQTVPAKFGEGATMVYQEWANECSKFNYPEGVGRASGALQSPSKSTANLANSAAAPKARASTPLLNDPFTNSEIFSNLSRSYEYSDTERPSSSAGYSKNIQTGPRGGQYYLNSNGNKTYVSGGKSGRR